MRDMRGVLIEKGDTILGINLECLDHNIGIVVVVNSDLGRVYLEGNSASFYQEDCLVLPSYYKEKIVE